MLVIDDDPTLITLISEGLSLVGGYDVAIATNGAMGLERFYETMPDCVVVDVRMPGLNGYQFVRALRGDPMTMETPIIVLSAMAQDRDELAGMLAGADSYLFKPVKITDLLVAIDKAMTLTAEKRHERKQWLSGYTSEYTPAEGGRS
ncbi:MAG TPA: response regulator [Ktedonobacterales bacterium]|nr:response regulator [Ktedonobacterales bacterium]